VESEELRESARQEAANLHKNTLNYIDSLLAETDRKMSELINNIRLERNEIQNRR
jgi:predicted component of type VI protein secretion system